MDAITTAEAIASHNFHRPLDWRWQHAGRIASTPQVSAERSSDQSIADLVRFRCALEGTRSTNGIDRVNVSFPALATALRLRDDDGRCEVEARILAGQTDDEIAQRCSLWPEVVCWYERAFFHIRDRLTAGDWIMTQVIGDDFATG